MIRRILTNKGERKMIQKILRSQKGFTLIELLVAVGILAVLAGIAVPVVIRFTGTADTTAQAAEFTSVQTAVDGLMADERVSDLNNIAAGCTVYAGAGTNDMTAFPCTGASQPVLSPGYLRQTTTTCTYTVANDGTVSQAACP